MKRKALRDGTVLTRKEGLQFEWPQDLRDQADGHRQLAEHAKCAGQFAKAVVHARRAGDLLATAQMLEASRVLA